MNTRSHGSEVLPSFAPTELLGSATWVLVAVLGPLANALALLAFGRVAAGLSSAELHRAEAQEKC